MPKRIIKAITGLFLGLLGWLLGLELLNAIFFAFRNYKSFKDLVDVLIYGFLSFSLLYMAYRLLREAFPRASTAHEAADVPSAPKPSPPPAP